MRRAYCRRQEPVSKAWNDEFQHRLLSPVFPPFAALGFFLSAMILFARISLRIHFHLVDPLKKPMHSKLVLDSPAREYLIYSVWTNSKEWLRSIQREWDLWRSVKLKLT